MIVETNLCLEQEARSFIFSPEGRTGITDLFLLAAMSCGQVFVFSWLSKTVLKEKWEVLAQIVHFVMVVCGNFIASRDGFHMDALLHVTVLEELIH